MTGPVTGSVTGSPTEAATRPERGPELEVALDVLRRALPVLPVWAGLCWLVWGAAGAASAAYASAVVVANLLVSALLIERAARISPTAIAVATLAGYPVRLGLVTVAVLLVTGAGWFSAVPLGITIIVTHLGLLAWEARHVSLSLAYPGLKPGRRS